MASMNWVKTTGRRDKKQVYEFGDFILQIWRLQFFIYFFTWQIGSFLDPNT